MLGIEPGRQAHCIITTVTATVTHIPYLHKFGTAYTQNEILMLVKPVKVKWLSFLCAYLSTTTEDIWEAGGRVLYILNLRTVVRRVFNCMAQQWK